LRIGYLNITSDWRGSITGVLGLRGSAALEKVGIGKLTFHQPQDYDSTTIRNGSIELVGQGGIGRGNVQIDAFASLVANRSDELVVHNELHGTGTFEQAGTGTSVLTAANTLDGLFLVSNGTLEINGHAGSLGSSASDVWAGATLRFTRAANYAYDGMISGGGHVVQDGSGIISLSGDNSIHGDFTVKQSELQVTGAGTRGALGHSDVEIWDGAVLSVIPTADYTYQGVISGAGEVKVKAAGGDLILTGNHTLSGRFLVDAGAGLVVGDGANTGSLGAANTEVDGTLSFNRSDSYTYSGQIDGSDGLVVQKGAGKTILTKDGLMTGKVEVRDGTLQLGNGGNTGKLDWATEFRINSPGTLTFNHNLDHAFSRTLTGDGALRQEGANTLTLTGDHPAYTGGITVNSGTLRVTGELPQASVRVNMGAVLQGDGKIGTQAAKTILISENGGTVSPGMLGSSWVGDLSVGNVTLRNGSIMQYDLGAVGNNDRILATGTGGADVLVQSNTTLNILKVGDFDPAENGGGIYPLIDGQNLDPLTQPDNLVIGAGAPVQNAYLFTTEARNATVNLVLLEHNEASWNPEANVDTGLRDFGTFQLNQGSEPDTRTVFNLFAPTDFRCLMQMGAVTAADYSGNMSHFTYSTSAEVHDVQDNHAAAAFTTRFNGSSTEGTYSLTLTIPKDRFTDEEIQQLLLEGHHLGDLKLYDSTGSTQSSDLVFTWSATVIPEPHSVMLLLLGALPILRRRRLHS
jgi:autotransporter-associated beta strand protein